MKAATKRKPASTEAEEVAGPRFESMKLSDCLAMAHERNPKEHNIQSLIAAFQRFGFVAFPTIDESTLTMVAGHGRCRALEVMRARGDAPPSGITAIEQAWSLPVVRGIRFRSKRERDAYVIADNQQVIAGGWKFDLLSELIRELNSDDGLQGLGFEEIELSALLGQREAEDPSDGVDPEAGDRPEGASFRCPHCGEVIER